MWQDNNTDFDEVDNCLQVIEACTSASQVLPEDVSIPLQVTRLTNLLVGCHLAACGEDILSASAGTVRIACVDGHLTFLTAFDCMMTALRVLINLVNLEEDYVTAFVEETPVLSLLVQLILASEKPSATNSAVSDNTSTNKTKVSVNVLKFDLLCLSLGLLTNLLESYKGDGCKRFIETSQSSLCAGDTFN